MQHVLKKLIELIFPNQCLNCNNTIGQDGAFCNSCWLKLQFITDPKCNICSHPFEFQVTEELICPTCLNKKPSYDKTMSAFVYNEVIKKIISHFKYHDNSYLAKRFSKILYHRFLQDIEEVDLIICVPLHKKRLRMRKFNQALLLAKELSKLTTKPFSHDYLLRVKNTTAQAGLKKKEREKNLKGAFAFNPTYQTDIKNKRILLVDDVMTTGATLESCSKILKKSGAKQVNLLVIAKTIFN